MIYINFFYRIRIKKIFNNFYFLFKMIISWMIYTSDKLSSKKIFYMKMIEKKFSL